MLPISSWPMLISIGDAQARCSGFSSTEPWLTLLCCRQHTVPANSVSFSVPLLLIVSKGRKRRIKLKRWNEENHQIVRLCSLPSWGDSDGFFPVFLQFLSFVVAAFCRARPSVLPTSGWFKEHLIFSAHQFCTYQPSSTIKYYWGICVCYIWGIRYMYVFQNTLFLKLWQKASTGTKTTWKWTREVVESTAVHPVRFCVLPCAPEYFCWRICQMSSENTGSRVNKMLKMFLYSKDVFKYVLKFATCIYKEDILDWKTNFYGAKN